MRPTNLTTTHRHASTGAAGRGGRRWLRHGQRPIAVSLALAAVLGVLGGVLAVVAPSAVQPASAGAGDGTITVRVVWETNGNGLVEPTYVEPPLSGVTVRFSDSSGHDEVVVTDEDGLAVLDASAGTLVGGRYRIDVANPDPAYFEPAFAANGQSGAASSITGANLANPNNAKLSPTTEFVDVTGGTDAYVNTAFWHPDFYCQLNAPVVGACQTRDNESPGSPTAAGGQTLFTVPYQLTEGAETLATKAETGTVYGIAWSRQTQLIYSSAYAKRSSDYGPGGPGAIYVTSYPGGGTSLFAVVPNANDTSITRDFTGGSPGFHDFGYFDRVGKESLGELEITRDGQWLFTVNLFEKRVYVYDTSAPAMSAPVHVIDLPSPCADEDDWRPFGLGVGVATQYVGGVCTAQSSQDRHELSAHIWELDVANGTLGAEVLNDPMDYGRGIVQTFGVCNGDPEDTPNVAAFFPWLDDVPSAANAPNAQREDGCPATWFAYPQPILGDIIEDMNGDLIVSFRDRMADQIYLNAPGGHPDAGFDVASGGDILRACRLAGGGFVLDPNLSGADTLAPGARCDDNNVAGVSGGSGGQETTFREYYVGDHRAGGPHDEAFFTGMALSYGETTVLSSALDPGDAIYSNGVARIERSGTRPTSGTAGQAMAAASPFGKAAGMADLEVLCDFAPIQIGNRLWYDLDGDGVQDPDEDPVVGATVRLYDELGAEIGEVVTDSRGYYYFDDGNVDDGIAQNTTYTIRVDNPDDRDDGGPLVGTTPTVANAGDDDQADSDGVVPDGELFPQVTITTGGAGQNDHTIDFGFVAPAIGDTVWIDADRDGIQDDGELPVAGVTVNLYDDQGDLVATTVTDANGKYLFDRDNVDGGLAPGGVYTIRLDNPDDYEPGGPMDGFALTVPNQGEDDGLDSDATPGDDGFPEIVATVPADGTPDLSFDFGVFSPSVSVGDYVWVDTDRDGIQDPGEPGIPGVVLIVRDSNGDPVTDVYGNPVGPATTDENGLYSFDDLPIGEAYTVTIDQGASAAALEPYVPTQAGAGDDPGEDSSTDTATSRLLTVDGDRDPTLDFGFHLPSASVGDFVWVDTDRDGIQDPGEPGIPGVVLVITDANGDPVTDVFGNPVGPATTDANGLYSFDDLPVGVAYTVTIDQEASATALAPYLPTQAGQGDPDEDSSTDTATSRLLTEDGDRDPTLDFGFVAPSVSVGDLVWVDTNRDGIQDPGEPGIPGVVLTIRDANGDPVTDVFGNPVGPATTDGNGLYSFDDLPVGQYTVTIDQAASVAALAPYIPTVAGQGDADEDSSTGSATSAVLTEDGDRDPTLDFGFVSPSVSVGDFVWVDTDRDGVQDPGEPGIPGVVLTIRDANGDPVTDVFGNPVGPATTDENGLYSFDDLPVGQYTVTIDQGASAVALAPYVPTVPGAGGDPSRDSSTGSATSGVLEGDGARDATLDFGFVPPSVSVGDFVWIDEDRDGIQEPGEPGIGGVRLVLTGPDGGPVTDVSGNPVGPVLTGPDGSYLFAGLPVLPAGQSYTVTVAAAPADPVTVQGEGPVPFSYLAPTPPGAGSDRGRDSSTGFATSGDLTENGASDRTLDFGFYRPSTSIEGQLWRDDDGDGLRDPGEAPLVGVLLRLTGPDGQPVVDVHGREVGPVRTDADGTYEFTDLPVLAEGQSYTVSIVRNDRQTAAAVAGLVIPADGRIAVFGLDSDGDVGIADFPLRPSPQAPPRAAAPRDLARTGAAVLVTFALGLLLLVAGSNLLVARRRLR